MFDTVDRIVNLDIGKRRRRQAVRARARAIRRSP